jgi:hypothetical protein
VRLRDNYDEALSCTRAGLLIIIISGLGLSLLGPIEIRIALNDLEPYIALRVTLAAQLEEIDHNPCVANKEIPLVALSRSDCFKNYTAESNPAIQAISALHSLNNITKLEKARRGYYANDYSIYRWKLRINSVLLSGNNYDNVTFRTVKELSDFEYPDMSVYDRLFRKYTLLETQWTPVTVRLTAAITFLELGLFIALAYFWLMFLEATYSGTSRTKGTIFMAASRTWLSRSLSFGFVSFPPVVSGLVLFYFYPLGHAERLHSSIVGINELIFIAIVIMSAMLWRTAQIDWSKNNAN